MAKTKKTAKKAKRKNSRGNWSTKPIISLSFANLKKGDRGGDFIKVTKLGVYFSPVQMEALEIDKKTFLLFAVENGQIYVAKKPKGIFGGHRAVFGANKAGEVSKRPYVALKSAKYGLKEGSYTLGKSVRTSLDDINGNKVVFEAYVLSPL
jgi:hypothetical protein